jgi:cytochrome P450
VAGFETTVNLISNAVLALLAHPEQWQALCADPAGLAPPVVEEVLRWDPPVQRTSRIALEPVELEGQLIRQGQQVITLIGAANRDPVAYQDPDTFDPTRFDPARTAGTPPHLAFASGIHYCLGHALARAEAAVALRLLATRMPALSRSGPIRRRNTTIIRGPLHLPVTTRPGPRGVLVP